MQQLLLRLLLRLLLLLQLLLLHCGRRNSIRR